jgi:VWFA-related protein
MMRQPGIAVFAVVAGAIGLGQTPDHVIRINVNLVQVDAVVTDSKGKPVTDLQASDFEVLQDGKPQTISNFSRVELGMSTSGRGTPAGRGGTAAAVAAARLRPQDVRRTIALVVDDLGMSFDAMYFTRRALKKFVDEQMQPGDLVAVVRTGYGIGAFQQFTSDKRMLYAAIERLRYNSMGRIGITRFAPTGMEREEGGAYAMRNEQFTVGTLGAVRYIVNGLQQLPGRKAVVLFSEDLKLFRGDTNRVTETVRQLSDAANRASAVLYTVDPGGLRTTAATAEDRNPAPDISVRRSAEEFDSREGLYVLAKETGGQFFVNTDPEKALRDIAEETRGYYLLGYHPAAETFNAKTGRPDYHKITVRVKRPGLRVRSRTGFFGTQDRPARPAPKTRQTQIAQALESPFVANALEVRLTPLFTRGAKESYLNTLLYISGKDLTFTDEPDGWHKATIDVVTVTCGESGEPIDTADKTYTIRVKDQMWEQAQKGLLYSVRHPVRKPGAYQMRVVVRDAGSTKIGSANQFIEVPDVGKGRLLLSSILIQRQMPNAAAAGPDTPEGQVAAPDLQESPAVRSFAHGQEVIYGFAILNAKAEGVTPKLESQIRLFRDGKQVYEGKPLGLTLDNQTDPKRLLAGGHLALGQKIPPGDYILQVTVTDELAKKGRNTATQWTDFEIR